MRPCSVMDAQAKLVYKLIEENATGPCRRFMRQHHCDWVRAIFAGWEEGKPWRDVDVGDVRWYDMETELLVMFEWYDVEVKT